MSLHKLPKPSAESSSSKNDSEGSYSDDLGRTQLTGSDTPSDKHAKKAKSTKLTSSTSDGAAAKSSKSMCAPPDEFLFPY